MWVARDKNGDLYRVKGSDEMKICENCFYGSCDDRPYECDRCGKCPCSVCDNHKKWQPDYQTLERENAELKATIVEQNGVIEACQDEEWALEKALEKACEWIGVYAPCPDPECKIGKCDIEQCINHLIQHFKEVSKCAKSQES